MLVLHPAPTCADGCWCPVPLTFSNLRWWCFSFQQLAQTLYLHLWWLPSATCAGGLFPSTTCAYSNLHCVVVYIYIYNHHHTVQVAMCAYSFVRTLVNALVLQGKTPPAQVAAGDDHHECKWSIFASWWKEKHHQRKFHSVKTILGTSIGAGCSNQIQVAQGQDLHYAKP